MVCRALVPNEHALQCLAFRKLVTILAELNDRKPYFVRTFKVCLVVLIC